MEEKTNFTHIGSAAFTHIELFYRGQEITLSEQDLPYTLGRDPGKCQLVIDHQKASRVHCTVMVEEGQIGLRDSSTNGTAVQLGRSGSIIVKDRFYPLTGQGCLQLGRSIVPDDPSLIYFKMVDK